MKKKTNEQIREREQKMIEEREQAVGKIVGMLKPFSQQQRVNILRTAITFYGAR